MITRIQANILVLVLVGLGIPAYFKAKYYLIGQLTLGDIFTWGIFIDLSFGFGMSSLVVVGHELVVRYLRKRFPARTSHTTRFLIQMGMTTLYAWIAVYSFTQFFFNVLFPFTIGKDTWLDLFIMAFFIPIFVNGVKESVYYYGEWEAEYLRREQLQKENIKAQYEILKNQINPHFLFNSFNTLTELIDESKELAIKFLQQLSRVYRFVLEHKDTEVVELDDELKVLDSYLFLLKIRFGENLQVHYNLGNNPSHYNIVPLTLQILLENALKHNVVSKDNPLKVDIELSKDSKLVFKNNLQKRKAAPSTKTGLQNIINRYRFISDQSVDIMETPTDFVVKVPLIRVEAV